ncbi:MAG: hypothetical protein K2X93_09475 [Candidatus Obscuribacterales bacterium]|nr:hypothetical protein [Candidatus Obscuribacterales bacterium]
MRKILTAIFILAMANSPFTALPSSADEDKSVSSGAANQAREYYFLHVNGKGMPVKHVLINGVNVLGGSVISLTMPINITKALKSGLNDMKVKFVSHDKEGLITIVERRKDGPEKHEVLRMALEPNASNGAEVEKELVFNVDPAPEPPEKIELTQDDRQKLFGLVESYYAALKKKNPSKLRALYQPALTQEKRIFPEGADFFSKVLEKEIVLLKRKDVKMGSFDSNEIMLEQEGDKIKALRKDRKPMMESNEVDVNVDTMLAEVPSGPKKTAKSASSKMSAKQRLVTTTLLFKRIDGQWRVALPRGV